MPTFKEAFRGKEVILAEKLDMTDSLLRRMKTRGVILQSHITKIKTGLDNGAQVDILLEILERRPDSLFETFCDVLNEEERDDIVEILRKPNYNSLH